MAELENTPGPEDLNVPATDSPDAEGAEDIEVVAHSDDLPFEEDCGTFSCGTYSSN